MIGCRDMTVVQRYIFILQVATRAPLFDQLIANAYQPGEGLKPHVDLMRFQDGIAIVSLLSATLLTFTMGEERVDVLLDPGDLLLLEGQARCAVSQFCPFLEAEPCLVLLLISNIY